MFKGFVTQIHPKDSLNNIIYVGDAHAEIYRQFFDSMEYERRDLLIQNIDSLERCVHINAEIAYPMFGIEPCTDKMVR
jgi:hypothetical protein